MGINPQQDNSFIKINKLEERMKRLEQQVHSASSILAVGSIILTPQADAFFTDVVNKIEGNLAYKNSDNKVYVYNGSAWTALH